MTKKDRSNWCSLWAREAWAVCVWGGVDVATQFGQNQAKVEVRGDTLPCRASAAAPRIEFAGTE